MQHFIDHIQNSLNETSVIFGSVIQYIVIKEENLTLKKRFKLLSFLVLSSIFTALYVVAPLVEHFKLEGTKLETSLYAVSSLISIEVIKGIINLLPKYIKEKIKEKEG